MSHRAIGRSAFAFIGAFVLVASATVDAQPRAGSVGTEKPKAPVGSGGADSTSIDRDVERGDGGERDGLDLGSARLAYAAKGGLLVVDNLLTIDDDGAVRYRATSSAFPRENFEIDARLAESHVRALKLLVRESGFASMPAAFEPDGVVMDGLDFAVAARLPDGREKTVWSTTAAVEPLEFSRLRATFDEIVAEIRSAEVLKLTSYPGEEGGTIREFRLLADGRFRIEIREGGEPVSWGEGRLLAADRRAIASSLGKFDFAGSRMCRAGVTSEGESHELVATVDGAIRAVTFSSEGGDTTLEPLIAILAMAKHAAEGVGL